VIAVNSSAAVSRIFALAIASPMPMLITIFCKRGVAIGFVMPNSFERGRNLFRVTLF
jgi:hypothetical protein